MRLSYESIIAPENGTSGVPFDDQALLSGITVDATKLNMLDGITGNVQSRLNDLVGTGGTLTGNVVLNGAPSAGLHAASKAYVDGLTVSGKLPSSGGTMTGALTLSGVATSALGAITKQQMDDAIAAASGGSGTGSLIENWPRWDTNPSEQVGAGWASFQSKLNAIITEVRKAPLASYSRTNATGTFPGSVGSGVLLPDGRVFMVFSNSTTGFLYDPVTDTLSAAGGTLPGAGAMRGTVLMADGRVFIVPSTSTTARIYDPVTNTVSTPAGTYPGGGYFANGILLKDGRIYLPIYTGGQQAKIYDPVTNTLFTSTASISPAMDVRGNVCLLPDGKVLLVTFMATVSAANLGCRGVIYDPVTDTHGAQFVIESNTIAPFRGSVLLPDGRVFLVPSYATAAKILDPVTLAITTPSGVYPGTSGSFNGGVLLPDGRIFLIPYGQNYAKIYDPVTDTLVSKADYYLTSGFNMGILLPDGRVFLVPAGSGTAALLTANVTNLQGNKKLPNNMVLSPLMNHQAMLP